MQFRERAGSRYWFHAIRWDCDASKSQNIACAQFKCTNCLPMVDVTIGLQVELCIKSQNIADAQNSFPMDNATIGHSGWDVSCDMNILCTKSMWINGHIDTPLIDTEVKFCTKLQIYSSTRTDLCDCKKYKSLCHGWFDLITWHEISGAYGAKPGKKRWGNENVYVQSMPLKSFYPGLQFCPSTWQLSLVVHVPGFLKTHLPGTGEN